MLGRGGGSNNHVGNVNFRKLVCEHKMRYFACSKVEKPNVARDVVNLWRRQSPPGRFLTREGENWYEVGDKKAREKASQCLRERTPEVMPLLKQLREQQDLITERGVTMFQQQRAAMDSSFPLLSDRSISRRTSCPTMRGPPQPYSGASRRTSLPSVPQLPSAPERIAYQPTMASHMEEPLYANDPAYDLTEEEYQRQMLVMRRQMQLQQLQMQRMQQQRVALEAEQQRLMMMPYGVTSSSYHHSAPDMNYHHHHSQSHDRLDPLPLDHDLVGGLHGPLTGDPLLLDSLPSSPMRRPPQRAAPPLPARRSASPPRPRAAAPETAVSSSATTSPPNQSIRDLQNESLTIEEYRRQLEQYMAETGLDASTDPAATGAAAEDDEDDGLQDDWERERDAARLGDRGVNRTISGASFMSTDTFKSSGMSLMSGMSMLSEGSREKKMSTLRSQGSNLSLMSELTEISQSVDELRL